MPVGITDSSVRSRSPSHRETAPAKPGHNAFISYSRKDSAFAGRLQTALEKYTPPAGLDRAHRRLRAFRDQHDFTGTDYFAAIQKHLAGARKLIVICSPDAAASPYVDDEIERFANIGSRADERRQLSALVWNPHSREVAGMMYPSMLAYWSVPSDLVRSRLMAWRLTDGGLVETYRGGERENLSPVALAAGGDALLVSGNDGYRRIIDLSRTHLLEVSCAAVQRAWTPSEQRRYLGGIWRRPLRCEPAR